uniref:BAHD acyltransferase n=2 Tax=Chenopodium quinoa TaxID=63459 RepID=A0A803MUM9_CHEQI
MSPVKLISECFVRPKSDVEDSERYHYLSPLALHLISLGNTQYGLLFRTSSYKSNNFFDNLKLSLSHALVHFYPLAGRLVTKTYDEEHSCSIFVDCKSGPGARLIHASASDVTVDNIVNPTTDVPLVVQSFFDLGERQVNHDGHTRALLSVQMTEVADGLFIGCCINHCVTDGTSLSHFLNVLSNIFVSGEGTKDVILRKPVIKFPPSISEGFPIIKLPFKEPNEFITRFDKDHLLRDRVFHFSAATMSKLKIKANAEANNSSMPQLSSFKALCGFIWQSITRARNLPSEEETKFAMAVNIRSRIEPPLSPDHLANCFVAATATAKAGELLKNGLGYATMLIHDEVDTVNAETAREALVLSSGESPTIESPGFISLGTNCVVMGGSPRFDFSGAEFGLGKLVAIRTGYTNRADGKLTAFPGRDGPGSVDLQVGLLPEYMSALLLDEEFMNYVS